MRTILLFDPTPAGENISTWLQKQEGINVIFDKNFDSFKSHILTGNYDLIISEIEAEGVLQNELFEAVEQKKKDVFHVCVTDCKELYKIAFAEASHAREIVFKPVNFEKLKKAINKSICGKKNFLIACSEERSKYVSSTVNVLGHFTHVVSKKFELNRFFLEKPVDFVIYDDSFNGKDHSDFFRHIQTVSRRKLRSIALLNKIPDAVSKQTLEVHGVENIVNSNSNVEDIVKIIEDFIERQVLIETDSNKKEEEIKERERLEKKLVEEKKEKKLEQEKLEQEKKEKEKQAQRKAASGMSVIEFLHDLEVKVLDKDITTPIREYFKTGMPGRKDAVIQLLNSQQGRYLIQYFGEIFVKAEVRLKELILDVFSEIKDASAINLLFVAMNDKDPDVRFAALEGLEKKKDPRITGVITQKLLDGNDNIRKATAKFLEGRADFNVLKNMVDALKKYDDGAIARSIAVIIESKIKVKDNIKFIIEIYYHVPRDVKEVIISELIKTRSNEIIPFLLREMKSTDDLLSRLVIDGLDNLKEPMSLPGLIDYLKVKTEFYIQEAAINILQTIKSKKYLPLLEKVINEAPPAMKETAIEIAKGMSGKESMFILLKALGDQVPSVKMAAIDALSTRKKKYVVPSLVYLLDDKNGVVRDRTVKVLKSMVNKDDIDSLLSFFRRANTTFAKETISEFLRTMLVGESPSGFQKLLRTDSYHLLLSIIESKGYSLGEYTSEILGKKFTSEDSYGAIMKSLYSDSHDARAEALIALGKIKKPESLPHIIKSLSDKAWFIRRNAIEALKSFKNPKTIPYAEKFMNDENPAVRLAAAEFLSLMRMKYKERALVWTVAEETSNVLRVLPKLIASFKDQELANVYVEKMDAVEPNVRIQAACSLLDMWGNVNLDYFTKNQEHKNWRLRLFALMVICKKNIENARGILEKFKSDPTPEIRRILPEQFCTVLKKEGLPYIKEIAIKDEDLQVRKNAIKQLSSFDFDGEMQLFIHELLDKEVTKSGMMEIGFTIEAFDYEVPMDIMMALENKFPEELKQIIASIQERHKEE